MPSVDQETTGEGVSRDRSSAVRLVGPRRRRYRKQPPQARMSTAGSHPYGARKARDGGGGDRVRDSSDRREGTLGAAGSPILSDRIGRVETGRLDPTVRDRGSGSPR